MSVKRFLEEAASHGIDVFLEGDDLLLTGPLPLNHETVEQARADKPEIVAYLRGIRRRDDEAEAEAELFRFTDVVPDHWHADACPRLNRDYHRQRRVEEADENRREIASMAEGCMDGARDSDSKIPSSRKGKGTNGQHQLFDESRS